MWLLKYFLSVFLLVIIEIVCSKLFKLLSEALARHRLLTVLLVLSGRFVFQIFYFTYTVSL